MSSLCDKNVLEMKKQLERDGGHFLKLYVYNITNDANEQSRINICCVDFVVEVAVDYRLLGVKLAVASMKQV